MRITFGGVGGFVFEVYIKSGVGFLGVCFVLCLRIVMLGVNFRVGV